MWKKINITHSFKRVCAFIIVSFVFMIRNEIMVEAEDTFYVVGKGEEVYNYQDLLKKYEENSAMYIRNSISYQIEALNATIADETYNNYYNQYASILLQIAELNSVRKELITYRDTLLLNQEENSFVIEEIDDQIASIDAKLEQYNSSKNTLQTSVADANLQEDISSFYNTYQNALIKESQNVLKNDFLKMCYGLIINKEQISYYDTYEEYLAILLKIENIKYKLGRSNQLDINKVKVDIAKNEMSTLKYENMNDDTLALIQTNTNMNKTAKIKLTIPLVEKTYNYEQVVRQFMNNNTKYIQLQNFVISYQNYLNSASIKSAAQIKQIELQIKDYQLQMIEFNYALKTYVKKAINSYKSSFKAMKVAKQELIVKEEICNSIKAKIKYKKGTTLELNQAYVQKESAEIAYYQYCYEVVIWENIIENSIYGASP